MGRAVSPVVPATGSLSLSNAHHVHYVLREAGLLGLQSREATRAPSLILV